MYLILMLLTFFGASDINYETARFERRLKAVKITEKIEIDGRFDEPAWSGAPMAGSFIQKEPDEGEQASQPTEIRVLYDNDNLYFAVLAKDSEAGKLIINELKKDFNRDNGDSIEIAIDTFHDERNAYEFAVNPAGAKWDAQMNNEGRETNQSWDGVWYVKSRIIDDGWAAEIAIPFKTLKFPNVPVQTWGINFQRNLRRRNEDSFWSPLPRIYGIQRVSLAGTLEGLEGIEPGSNIKIKPYVFSSFAQNGRTNEKKGNADTGFDVKYGLTSGLTWDFTYNTDFSQVEADEQQINLTRFSLFFPEKRDFFLENSGIFQFGAANDRGGGAGGGGGGGGGGAGGGGGGAGGGGGGAGGGGRTNSIANDLIPFFSRNIGLSADGNEIPILGGTRLTGRLGRGYEIGILNIQQREFGETHATNFTVGRLRKNVLANSDIGVLLTNKEVLGSAQYNRVMGSDANFRFGRSTNVNMYIAKAQGPGIRSRDLAGRFGFNYQDDKLQLRSSYTSIQENFIDELGFVPRRGIRKFAGNIGYTWRPQSWRKTIRTISPHSQLDYVLDRDGRIDMKFVDYHVPLNFQNGAFVEIGKNPSIEYFSEPFKISTSRGISVPAGLYKYNEYFFIGRSDSSRKLAVNGRWGAGPFYTGYKHSYQAGATYRYNYKLTGSFTYTHNNISLHEGHFKTNLLSTRFNYGFTTTMFLNALVQYNSDIRQWSSNVRFNIIHRPLSDIFIVFNERRDSVTHNLIDRALIAKMTYMIAR